MRDTIIGVSIADEPVKNSRSHVIAGWHGQLGKLETRDIFVDRIQSGHETRNPGNLILATDDLQLGKALQDATIDEIIGER